MLSNTSSCYNVAPAASPRRFSPRLVGVALATAFVLVWTSGYLVGDIGTSAAPPLTLLFWRFLLASAVIGTIAVVTRAPWPTRLRDWVRPAAAGVLLQNVQFAGIYLGLSLGVSAGLASLIVSASPLVIAVAAVGLDGERLKPAGWVGLALGLAGVGVAVSTELSGGARVAGILLSVLGLAGFAAGTLLQKHAPASADLRTGTTIQIGAATITSVPLALFSGSGLALPLTANAVGSVVWLAVVNSVGGLLLLFVLLRRRSGAGATSYLFLVPPVTALLAVPVLGQPLHLAALAGVALAAVGVGLVSRSERKAPGHDRGPDPSRSPALAPAEAR